jgi:hypothetical protein
MADQAPDKITVLFERTLTRDQMRQVYDRFRGQFPDSRIVVTAAPKTQFYDDRSDGTVPSTTRRDAP